MRDVVGRFLARYLDGEQAEDWLVDYVIEYLSNDEMVAQGMSDLAEVLTPSCPGFDSLSESDRLEQLAQLHKQVQGQSLGPSQPETVAVASDTADQLATSGPAPHDPHEAALVMLRELCPAGVSQEFLDHVLSQHCGGRVEAAAEWLLECADVARQEAAWKMAEGQRRKQAEDDEAAERRARKAMLDRFMLQELKPVDSLKKQPAPDAWAASKEPCHKPNVRYRDGMVASTKGEKYVVQKLASDWDGGSKGKVYTKGKRGKGFV